MYGAEKYGDTVAPCHSVHTLDSQTNVAAGADCDGLNDCVSWIPRPSDTLAVSSQGGFVQTDAHIGRSR